jgi:hypothetical protein
MIVNFFSRSFPQAYGNLLMAQNTVFMRVKTP